MTCNNIEDVINLLGNDSIKLFKWFAGDQMNANKDKFHLLVSGSENITINLDGNIKGNSICEKLLGENVDYKLKPAFYVTVQLLPFGMDVSHLYNE